MLSFSRWLQVSTFLHCSILILLSLFKGNGGTGAGSENDKRTISPKSIDVSVISPPPASSGMDTIEEVKKSSGETSKSECKESYGGIGVVLTKESRIVSSVPPGWPAYRAGIKVGDRIISPDFEDVSGPAGTIVEIVFEAEDGIHTVTIIRENICIDDKE